MAFFECRQQQRHGRRDLALVALLALGGCTSSSSPLPIPVPTGSNQHIVSQVFSTRTNRDIDILFMIDNSPSMAPLQAKLAASFGTFATTLSSIRGGPPNAAARAFAVAVRTRGQVLADDWLNNGPASLANQLPADWQTRLHTVFSGAAIQLRCLGREDLLRSKLFALCDRGIDIGDCLALAPTHDELRTIGPWVEAQDANPNWPAHVQATLDDVAKRLGHAV